MEFKKRHSKKDKELIRQTAIEYLKLEYFKNKREPVVYTNIESVSSSGLSRKITFFVIKGNEPFRISHFVATILKSKYHKPTRGVLIHGAGMDMGFDAVQRLSFELFGDSNKIVQRWL